MNRFRFSFDFFKKIKFQFDYLFKKPRTELKIINSSKRVVKEGIYFWLVGPYHTRINFEDQDVIQPLLVMGTCDDSCHHVFFQLQGIKVTQKIIWTVYFIFLWTWVLTKQVGSWGHKVSKSCKRPVKFFWCYGCSN